MNLIKKLTWCIPGCCCTLKEPWQQSKPYPRSKSWNTNERKKVSQKRCWFNKKCLLKFKMLNLIFYLIRAAWQRGLIDNNVRRWKIRVTIPWGLQHKNKRNLELAIFFATILPCLGLTRRKRNLGQMQSFSRLGFFYRIVSRQPLVCYTVESYRVCHGFRLTTRDDYF